MGKGDQQQLRRRLGSSAGHTARQLPAACLALALALLASSCRHRVRTKQAEAICLDSVLVVVGLNAMDTPAEGGEPPKESQERLPWGDTMLGTLTGDLETELKAIVPQVSSLLLQREQDLASPRVWQEVEATQSTQLVYVVYEGSRAAPASPVVVAPGSGVAGGLVGGALHAGATAATDNRTHAVHVSVYRRGSGNQLVEVLSTQVEAGLREPDINGLELPNALARNIVSRLRRKGTLPPCGG